MSDSMKVAPGDTATESIGNVLEDALGNMKELVSAELALARKDLAQAVNSALASVLLLSVGVMFLQASLVILGVLLLLAFGAGWAGGAVVLAFFLLGAVLAIAAYLGLQKLRLKRTTGRLSDDGHRVMEAVHASTGQNS